MDIDAWPPEAAEPEVGPGPQLLAIDTNVLINRLALVQALHKRLLASEVWLFVPHVVVRELDHQKSSPRPDLRHAAQSASAWLRDVLRLARHTQTRLRLESLAEYRGAQGVYEPGLELKNDERILRSLTCPSLSALCSSSAAFEQSGATGHAGNGGQGGPGALGDQGGYRGCGGEGAGGGRITLWTEDVNFSLMAEAAGLSTIGKCTTLSAVLWALGLEDMDEGMELDLDADGGSDLFVRGQQQGHSPYQSSSWSSSTPSLAGQPMGLQARTMARSEAGTPTGARLGVHGGGSQGVAMPPPGILKAAIARLKSQCPIRLRPDIISALAAFAARYSLALSIPDLPPLPPLDAHPVTNSIDAGMNGTTAPTTTVTKPSLDIPDELAELYFDATLGVLNQLIPALDSSPLPLRQRAIQGSALRTLQRFVGPREKGDKVLPISEVREAVGVLDEGRGEWSTVLQGLEGLE